VNTVNNYYLFCILSCISVQSRSDNVLLKKHLICDLATHLILITYNTWLSHRSSYCRHSSPITSSFDRSKRETHFTCSTDLFHLRLSLFSASDKRLRLDFKCSLVLYYFLVCSFNLVFVFWSRL